jgi:hypothetical protein
METDDMIAESNASQERQVLPNGAAAAAILGAGIGSAALGLAVTLSESFVQIESFFKVPETVLHLSQGVGPLAGKTDCAFLIWLVAWVWLHFAWRGKQVHLPTVFKATIALVVLGLLGTFPEVFEAVNKLIGNHP